MKAREPAWRVFASEFNASTLGIKGEGEKAPSYVVTPLGAMVNRLFIVGILTDIQNLGTEQEPYWRATVSDGTDRFYIYAGKYAPEASSALAKIEPPSFVAVIGKSRTYSSDEGKFYVSVRAEKVLSVDEGIKDNWLLETIRATLRRIDAMEEALQMETPSVQSLVNLGFPASLADGVVRAVEHYQNPDVNRFRGTVLEALEQLLPDRAFDLPLPQDLPSPEEIYDSDIDGEDIDDGEKEEIVLKLIEKLDVNKKGAPLSELIKESAKLGIEEDELEEINNSLLDKGLIYEPTIGRMKRI
ncbi:MAG TPA: glycerol dehydrogenase [Methanomassiliicoccaceae archaeon]|nr:glycerol dehydrogenase [Methanomassiliicoccaceae archaeon]HQA21144.1 glycerol dehydrogenase [Methanomassiliicoccaceae archaeon]